MKFNISHVGKIESAEIEVKPLTIFIGQNNSGKTYAASSLWASLSYFNDITDTITNDKKSYNLLSEKTIKLYDEKIRKLLLNLISEKEYIWKISKKELSTLKNEINENIQKKSQEILTRCFKFDDFKNSQIYFSEPKISALNISFKFEASEEPNTKVLSSSNTELVANSEIESYDFDVSIGNLYGLNAPSISLSRYKDDVIDIAINYIIRYLMQYSYLGIFTTNFNKLIYIPAARTGLMYGIHEIVQSNFEQTNEWTISNKKSTNKNLNEKLQLTAPLVDFISSVNRKRSPIRNIIAKSKSDIKSINFLNSIIDGDISFNVSNQGYEYNPTSKKNLKIPLAATSSLITELSALKVLEGDIRSGSMVFLEEPEAHLHLAAQRQMARFIVKLVNKGCQMVITTHSDTFLQQLNNLLLLEKISKNDSEILLELDIEKDEIISNEKVAVYDFQCKNDKTQVKQLDFGQYGFIADSLNEVIFKLANETQRINDEIDSIKIKD